MIYITGDTHGSYSRIRAFVRAHPQMQADDVIIILGDTMLNYFGDERDQKKKRKVSAIPVTFLLLHGNHDRRPQITDGYERYPWMGGIVYRQPEYPNLLFAVDGEVYRPEGKTMLTVGGAYSVDKEYRRQHGYHWFPDEQPSAETKHKCEKALARSNWQVDAVLTHTCPLRYLPGEALFTSVDQSTVDQSTEEWLDQIEEQLDYCKWYCGHFHIDKEVDRLQFLYHQIQPFLSESRSRLGVDIDPQE